MIDFYALFTGLFSNSGNVCPRSRSGPSKIQKLAHFATSLSKEYGRKNTEAHYLYAANLGSSVQSEGFLAFALTVNTLKTHVRRVLELNPHHAPTHHMVGMMPEKLPWFPGGDPDMAITYLIQDMEVKPDYTGARLDLANINIKRQYHRAAREKLRHIIDEPSRSPGSRSWQHNLHEAERGSMTIHRCIISEDSRGSFIFSP